MAKIPYTVNVDEYVCSELETMRKMVSTLDFSGLSAAIERVQFHVSRMEDALYTYQDLKDYAKNYGNEKVSNEEFRAEIVKRAKEI